MPETLIENKVKLEILVSTMNRDSLVFLNKMFVNNKVDDYQILIINQTSKETLLRSEHPNIRVINSFEKGLSKSRNLAIKNAVGAICLIADDDVEYVAGFEKIIKSAYEKNKLAVGIIFKAEIFNKKTNPKYLQYSKTIDAIKELEQVSSVEMTFKRKPVQEKNIRFSEYFGINGFFPAGEEWLFLDEIKKYGMIHFENEVILRHRSESTGSKMDVQSLIPLKAVQYHIIYPRKFYYYLIKLLGYLIYHKHISITKFTTFFMEGIKARKIYVDKVNKELIS